MAAIRLSEHIRVPFDRLRKLLRTDPEVIVGGRPTSVVLRATTIGGIEVGKAVIVRAGPFAEVAEPVPVCSVDLVLQAADHPRWFPILAATLEVAQTGSDMVEMALVGRYRPPGGVIGWLANLLWLRRIAERSLRSYFEEVVNRTARLGLAIQALEGIPYS